jgi:hypothetical protein
LEGRVKLASCPPSARPGARACIERRFANYGLTGTVVTGVSPECPPPLELPPPEDPPDEPLPEDPDEPPPYAGSC